MSEFLPRLERNVGRIENAKAPPLHGTGFALDMWNYLKAYGDSTQLNGASLKVVRERVVAHDLSAIAVRLVASTPGTHIVNSSTVKWGHLKLREHLRHQAAARMVASSVSSKLISQFSSIGSLGKQESGWLGGEFVQSLRTQSTSINLSSSLASRHPPSLSLIYPTVENVRQSFEGYQGGDALPHYSKSVVLDDNSLSSLVLTRSY